MKSTISIKENREFSYLYRRGEVITSDCLVLYFRKNRLKINRLGITASKKVGKAVIRNRVRRRIKESYRFIEDRIPLGYDFIIVARSTAAEADYRKILSALQFMLKKAGLIHYEKNSYLDN